MLENSISTLDIISFIVAVAAFVFGFLSFLIAYIVFIISNKNFYKKFLELLDKKESLIEKSIKYKNIRNSSFLNFLVTNVKFFGETFFIDFSADGYLKYHQYKTIKTIYNHMKQRMYIAEKVFNKATKNKKDLEQINIAIQLFGKFNWINKTYFDNKLKDKTLSKDNTNVYAIVNFKYDIKTRKFIDLNKDAPSAIFPMGSDIEFKKNIYYIFSKKNRFINMEDANIWEKKYFFIACYLTSNKSANNLIDEDETKITEAIKKDVAQASKTKKTSKSNIKKITDDKSTEIETEVKQIANGKDIVLPDDKTKK